MGVDSSKRNDPTVELPASAPHIRITAGPGSAGQKTWNVRRPVTVIGSRRPAHIVLHDRDISKAHCVIVNTGTEVLVKDLHTSSGTRRNKEGVDLALLTDGDVLTIGTTRIQIAIRMPEGADSDDSGCDVEFRDPTKFSKPVKLHFNHTEMDWSIEEAVALIGRHEKAQVRIHHHDVSSRHALLFRMGDAPALLDLGSRTGIQVNKQSCQLAVLRDGDRVGIGPCTLLVGREKSAAELVSSSQTSRSQQKVPGDTLAAAASIIREAGSHHAAQAEIEATGVERVGGDGAEETTPGADLPPMLDGEPSLEASDLESRLGALQVDISGSWDQLNEWESRLRQDADKISTQESDLTLRRMEVEAKDAAIRGQLHDLTCLGDQLAGREQELAEWESGIRTEQDELNRTQTDLIKREGEVVRRSEELRRREHVLAQRWTRLQTANCAHCGKPVRARAPGSTGSAP